MDVRVKKLNDTEVEIVGSIGVDEFMKYRSAVLKELGDIVEIDGFRRGHIPENVLVSKVGENKVLEEMAEHALGKAYPDIIVNEKIDAIGRPEITITKLVAGNPLEFKIKQTVMPVIVLPDYKRIAQEVVSPLPSGETAVDVSDKEVDDVITEIRKQRKKSPTDETEVPPILDDIFAQSLGDFKGVDDLKSKIRNNMTAERKLKQKSARRQKIIEGVLDKTNFTTPVIFIEREMDTMMAELKDDIAHMGVKFEDYLKHIKKSEAEVRDSSRITAEKRARSWIVLAKIAEIEKIAVDADLLERETKKVLDHYKGADPLAARNYVEGILRNERVFTMLESQD